ncbi:hypothetical protein C8R41DRAFT_860459 [Lentinula lateritia]|uniref:CCHC-type domain-containing protein n=1 Tax=Lentinula lateritia TaxID=40482 RepID=A0ABQ8V366_9AGAR|nr:hypothetical protein C8R41DRAFT_860459 [Lentinula lateritia]
MCTPTTVTVASSFCVSHNAQLPSATASTLASTHSSETETIPDNYSRPPQCGHCGWRGDHAPNCPFRS